jgi:hypothetical protein
MTAVCCAIPGPDALRPGHIWPVCLALLLRTIGSKGGRHLFPLI